LLLVGLLWFDLGLMLNQDTESGASSLPNKSLVQLCSHLGGLNMFPQRLVAAMDVVLSQRMQALQFRAYASCFMFSGTHASALMAKPGTK